MVQFALENPDHSYITMNRYGAETPSLGIPPRNVWSQHRKLPRHGLHRKSGGVNKEWIESQKFEIEVAGERYPAKASLKAFTIQAMPESECESNQFKNSSILKRLLDPNTLRSRLGIGLLGSFRQSLKSLSIFDTRRKVLKITSIPKSQELTMQFQSPFMVTFLNTIPKFHTCPGSAARTAAIAPWP